MLLINEYGERVAHYDELHLFDADAADARGHYRESGDYALGQRIMVADTPVSHFGLTVCYNLRFSELHTAPRGAGAELVMAPSAFTTMIGAAYWQVLIRARTIETQHYLLTVGQGGVHPRGWETFGHPTIVDSRGRVPAERPQDKAVLLTARDAVEQADTRRYMPVVAHRRFSPPAEPRPARME